MKRKLVSIQRISEIIPISGKDYIAVAKILGWQVIIRKEDFEKGDLCVYCEVDSVLPEVPEFEFLKSKKYRIKTISMRGVLSQGIAFPLDIISKVTPAIKVEDNIVYFEHSTLKLEEGKEITGLLKVKKYIPICSGLGKSQIVGELPSFIIETDEPRLQSEPDQLKLIKGMPWYSTCKVDGSSASYGIKDEKVYVCLRGGIIKESLDSAYWEIYHKYNFKSILKKYKEIVVQGEIVGPNIQKNRLDLDEKKLLVFNVIEKGRQYGWTEMEVFCVRHNLDTVPLIDFGNSFNFTLEELIELAKGYYKSGKLREGLVFRPQLGPYVTPKRISFKVLNNDFLLKE